MHKNPTTTPEAYRAERAASNAWSWGASFVSTLVSLHRIRTGRHGYNSQASVHANLAALGA